MVTKLQFHQFQSLYLCSHLDFLLIDWYSWKTDKLLPRVTSTFFCGHELFRFFVRSAFAELGLIWRMVVPQKIQLADLLELPTSQTYQRGQDTVPMPQVAFSVLPAPANRLVFLPKGACPMEQETLFKTFSVASLRSFCGTTDPENSKGFQWAQRRQLPLNEALLRMKRFKLLIQRSFLAVRIHSFTSSIVSVSLLCFHKHPWIGTLPHINLKGVILHPYKSGSMWTKYWIPGPDCDMYAYLRM